MAKNKTKSAASQSKQPQSETDRKSGFIFQLAALAAVIILAGYLLVSGLAGDPGSSEGTASNASEQSQAGSGGRGDASAPASEAGATAEQSGRQVLEAIPGDGDSEERLPAAPVDVEPRVLRFGEVPRNTIVTGEVKLTNTGSSPVRIMDARPSCPCTTTSRPANTIAPGQTVAIEIEMDTESKLGVKTVTVHVLLAGYDRIRIPIQATVQ